MRFVPKKENIAKACSLSRISMRMGRVAAVDAGGGDKSHHLSADNCCDTNTGRGYNCGMVEM